jgi:hypothetical protein
LQKLNRSWKWAVLAFKPLQEDKTNFTGVGSRAIDAGFYTGRFFRSMAISNVQVNGRMDSEKALEFNGGLKSKGCSFSDLFQ